MALSRYHLGCPVWSNRDWIGDFFTANAKPANFLRQYSAVFDTVEGNNCFYGLPKPETVLRWRDEAAPGFRFCFKLPRSISHERRLRGVAAETAEFLDRLAPLTDAEGRPINFAPTAGLDIYTNGGSNVGLAVSGQTLYGNIGAGRRRAPTGRLGKPLARRGRTPANRRAGPVAGYPKAAGRPRNPR